MCSKQMKVTTVSWSFHVWLLVRPSQDLLTKKSMPEMVNQGKHHLFSLLCVISSLAEIVLDFEKWVTV